MNNFNEMFNLISRNPERLFDVNTCGEFFSDEEECPYGDAVYCSIEETITYYRESAVQQGIPGEVSARLHKVIRKQWFLSVDDGREEGR
ncbi:MAG: hypothetical protein LWY06_07315 [Firmicutes bacterium]|nr:hypothetical protein [Bacillota bacterium]